MTDVPRAEYPRPRLRRERWASLNGPWGFAFDDDDGGRSRHWHTATAPTASPFDRRIIVPFCYQSPASGIDERARHDVVWYARSFDDVRGGGDERLLLHFGAVDYRATVWVNGDCVAEHEGGHTPFSADVTDALSEPGNVVVVRAEDPLHDLEIPRGKQYWGGRSERIFYTPTTGIWQSVWLEPVPRERIVDVRTTPDLDAAAVDVVVELAGIASGTVARIVVRRDDLVLVDDIATITGRRLERRYSVVPPTAAIGADVADWQGVATWTPEHPRLHDLRVQLARPHGEIVDAVDTYFGMRKVATRDGRVYLNNRPYYQRLVLDQGYFPDGLLTAASDDDLRRDIELAKELGFNGARKHQKIEDPRWLHWADRLGFLVWEEMPSAYQHSPAAVARLTAEWQAVMRRDHSHPSVVAWVPMNESWGVPRLSSDPRHRDYLIALYHLTRALDGTRLVVSNDGWEHGRTDVCTVHDYSDPVALRRHYADVGAAVAAEPGGRPLFLDGQPGGAQPLLVSEFGGIAVEASADSWGYRTVRDGDALLQRYDELMAAVAASPVIQGFCYTQLTDVEQEANGLLTFDRKPKANPADLRRATQQPGHD